MIYSFFSETFYYIPLVVLVLMLIVFIIYFKKSEDKNRRVDKYAILSRKTDTYSMKIDYKTETITFYKKGDIEGNEIPFDVFIQFVSPEDQKKYQDWINKIKTKRLQEKEYLYLTISNLEGFNSIDFYKLAYSDSTSNVIYCTCEKSSPDILDEDIKLYTFEDYRQTHSSEKKSRVVYCINFGLYQTILNRYGKVAADKYIQKLYNTLLDYSNKNRTIMYYKDDVFLIVATTIFNLRRLSFFADRLLNDLTTTLFFFNIQVEIVPTIGISSAFSEFSSLTEFADSSYQASLNTSSSRVRFYDERMIRTKKKEIDDSEELKTLMNSIYDSTTLSPVISLLDGQTIGYFPEVKFNDDKYKSFNDAHELAKRIDKETTFFYNTTIAWLKKYLSNKKNKSKLFLFVDLERMFNLFDILKNSSEYGKAEIVAIITDYDSLINKPARVKDMISLAESYHIVLGVVANDKMVTALSSSLGTFAWLVLPSKLTSSINVDNKDKFRVQNIMDATDRFNLNVLAWDVSLYPVADTLKGLGIDFLEGSILDNESDDIISKRQLAKLIDEGELK